MAGPQWRERELDGSRLLNGKWLHFGKKKKKERKEAFLPYPHPLPPTPHPPKKNPAIGDF